MSGERAAAACYMYSGAPQDPFGDVIKKIMNAIHYHAQLKPNSDLGSQNYEQWVVQMERKGQCSIFTSPRHLPVFIRTVRQV